MEDALNALQQADAADGRSDEDRYSGFLAVALALGQSRTPPTAEWAATLVRTLVERDVAHRAARREGSYQLPRPENPTRRNHNGLRTLLYCALVSQPVRAALCSEAIVKDHLRLMRLGRFFKAEVPEMHARTAALLLRLLRDGGVDDGALVGPRVPLSERAERNAARQALDDNGVPNAWPAIIDVPDSDAKDLLICHNDDLQAAVELSRQSAAELEAGYAQAWVARRARLAALLATLPPGGVDDLLRASSLLDTRLLLVDRYEMAPDHPELVALGQSADANDRAAHAAIMRRLRPLHLPAQLSRMTTARAVEACETHASECRLALQQPGAATDELAGIVRVAEEFERRAASFQAVLQEPAAHPVQDGQVSDGDEFETSQGVLMRRSIQSAIEDLTQLARTARASAEMLSAPLREAALMAAERERAGQFVADSVRALGQALQAGASSTVMTDLVAASTLMHRLAWEDVSLCVGGVTRVGKSTFVESIVGERLGLDRHAPTTVAPTCYVDIRGLTAPVLVLPYYRSLNRLLYGVISWMLRAMQDDSAYTVLGGLDLSLQRVAVGCLSLLRPFRLVYRGAEAIRALNETMHDLLRLAAHKNVFPHVREDVVFLVPGRLQDMATVYHNFGKRGEHDMSPVELPVFPRGRFVLVDTPGLNEAGSELPLRQILAAVAQISTFTVELCPLVGWSTDKHHMLLQTFLQATRQQTFGVIFTQSLTATATVEEQQRQAYQHAVRSIIPGRTVDQVFFVEARHMLVGRNMLRYMPLPPTAEMPDARLWADVAGLLGTVPTDRYPAYNRLRNDVLRSQAGEFLQICKDLVARSRVSPALSSILASTITALRFTSPGVTLEEHVKAESRARAHRVGASLGVLVNNLRRSHEDSDEGLRALASVCEGWGAASFGLRDDLLGAATREIDALFKAVENDLDRALRTMAVSDAAKEANGAELRSLAGLEAGASSLHIDGALRLLAEGRSTYANDAAATAHVEAAQSFVEDMTRARLRAVHACMRQWFGPGRRLFDRLDEALKDVVKEAKASDLVSELLVVTYSDLQPTEIESTPWPPQAQLDKYISTRLLQNWIGSFDLFAKHFDKVQVKVADFRAVLLKRSLEYVALSRTAVLAEVYAFITHAIGLVRSFLDAKRRNLQQRALAGVRFGAEIEALENAQTALLDLVGGEVPTNPIIEQARRELVHPAARPL